MACGEPLYLRTPKVSRNVENKPSTFLKDAYTKLTFLETFAMRKYSSIRMGIVFCNVEAHTLEPLQLVAFTT